MLVVGSVYIYMYTLSVEGYAMGNYTLVQVIYM